MQWATAAAAAAAVSELNNESDGHEGETSGLEQWEDNQCSVHITITIK